MALTYKEKEIEGSLATGSSAEFTCPDCDGRIIFDGYMSKTTCQCGYIWVLNDITANGLKWVEEADDDT